MGRYARNTRVDFRKSIMDIEKELTRFGASKFAYIRGDLSTAILFEYHGKAIRMQLELPNMSDDEFKLTPTGRKTSTENQIKKWEQGIKQRWRALLLLVKAKLVSIEDGISSFEVEFLPYIVTSNRKTIAENIVPNLDKVNNSNMLEFFG
jgi:hypothetical protein